MVLDSNENCLVYGQIGKEGIPVPVGGVWGQRYVGIRTVGSEFFRSSQAMKQTGAVVGKGGVLNCGRGFDFTKRANSPPIFLEGRSWREGT